MLLNLAKASYLSKLNLDKETVAAHPNVISLCLITDLLVKANPSLTPLSTLDEISALSVKWLVPNLKANFLKSYVVFKLANTLVFLSNGLV